MYDGRGTLNRAETIIRGYAVCYDHVGLVAQGLEWRDLRNNAMELLRIKAMEERVQRENTE